MARRIPLPRLTQRQRTARWQRERRQQAIIVVAFSAILFFVLGLMAWGATDLYYRHILVMPDKDAKDKDVADKAALEKATGIAKQLKEKPNDQDLWNKLAKESSDDPGSKDSGGELGWVGKGQFVKEFEDAATPMQLGQVSDPVKSQFGY